MSSQKHKPQLIAVVIGTRSITRAAVVDPGTFQNTASTNTPPADSTTRNTPLPASITSNDIISSESSNLNNNQVTYNLLRQLVVPLTTSQRGIIELKTAETIVSERQPINSNNSIVDLAPTVMSQLQKSNPFRELSALAARIKLKATISGAHRLLPQQRTLLNQSSSSLTSTCLGTEGHSNQKLTTTMRMSQLNLAVFEASAQKELELESVAGLYDPANIPLESFRMNPCGLVPKRDNVKGQSYPSSLGPIFFSINDDIEKEIFHASYENVGHVAKWTRTFGKVYFLYKLDIKDQCSILSVDPLSKHYKGLPVLTRSLLSVIEIQPGPFVANSWKFLKQCWFFLESPLRFELIETGDADDYKQTEELQILHCDAATFYLERANATEIIVTPAIKEELA
nr:8820_t:CDS:2 [Entrophospora candida]